MKTLEQFIEQKIEILKKAAELSKAQHEGTREDISWFAMEKAQALQEVLTEWRKEKSDFENICANWREHDDIDPSTGEYYSKAHQLRVMGKSNRP